MKRQLTLIATLILVLFASALTATRNGVAGGRPVAAGDGIKKVTMYLLYNDKTGIHYYTTDAARRKQAEAQGFFDIAPVCEIYSYRPPGEQMTLLYVLDKNMNFGSIFAYPQEKFRSDQLVGGGWTFEGIAGALYEKQKDGTVPLFMLYFTAAAGNQHKLHEFDTVLTTSALEVGKQEKIGYSLVGTIGYVFPPEAGKSGTGKYDPSKKPDPATELATMHCAPVIGKPDEYNCPTVGGYQLCEFYRKAGELNIATCHTSADLTGYENIHDQLVGLGCETLLGKAGQFICKTKPGLQACDQYLKSSNGLITKCVSALPIKAPGKN